MDSNNSIHLLINDQKLDEKFFLPSKRNGQEEMVSIFDILNEHIESGNFNSNKVFKYCKQSEHLPNEPMYYQVDIYEN